MTESDLGLAACDCTATAFVGWARLGWTGLE